MRTLLVGFLAAYSLFAQNTPVVSGANPSVQLGNTLYNIGTIRFFTGTGIPTTVITPSGTPPVQGDMYQDAANRIFYECTQVTCVSNGWQRQAYPTVVSVTAFGVNGTLSDASNFQTALTTASGNFCLYIPTGVTINMGANNVSVPSNTCLSGDNPANSRIASSGLATPSVGILDIPANSTNISFSKFSIDGGVTTPVGVLYSTATSGGPVQSTLSTGSSIWAHGGTTNVTILDCLINHTGGYAALFDATVGNISGVTIRNTTVQNSRPNLFGTSGGAEFYGSWTGGILFFGPGATYNFQKIMVDSSTFQNVTGNALWTSNGGASISNIGITFTNNTFVDVGLDAIQVAWTTNYIEYGNKVTRFGYVITSDVGSTRVGGPMWLQGFTPVAFDTYGALENYTRGPNSASGNGEMIDCDGCTRGGSIVGNTFDSCFSSLDPLANSGQCGPSVAVGSNYTRGMTIGNSAGASGPPANITIDGNSFFGLGNGGIVAFPCQYCTITGNTIQQTASFDNPIVLGNISTSPSGHSNGNLVTKNTIFWAPGSGSPAVFEDGTSVCACPFSSSDINYVLGNNIQPAGGNVFEFQKATPDNSGTGALHLSSVTPGATAVWESVIQTEGSGASTPALNFYSNPSGAGTREFTMTTSGASPISVLFANLPAIVNPGQFVYCTNCTTAATCAGGGTGHMAVSNGSAWTCQ